MEYKIKDTIEFGNYWQDKNIDAGKKPIEWIILDIKDNKLFLLSKWVIDNKCFDDSNKNGITWEYSSLRKWLNNVDTLENSFINNAFNETEQERILDTEVPSERNDVFCLHFGRTTRDKIFILSINDAVKYFNSDEERIAHPTEYVKSNNAVCNTEVSFNNNENVVQWWLRNQGRDKKKVSNVLLNGRISFCGTYGMSYSIFVRPALWVKI